MAIQLRRGTNQERLGITLVEGEVVYVTDFELVTIEVTSFNPSTDTLTTTLNHGLAVNDRIKFIGNSALGLVEGTVYWVKSIPSQTDFTLSTTQGGTTLNITGTAGVTSQVFAVGPTDNFGVPYGYSISPLYVGDGITAGGNPAGASVLDDLYDVTVGVYGNVGQYGQALRNGDMLVYNDVTNQWENTNVVATNVADNRLVAQFDSNAAGVNIAMTVRKNYGATNYTNNDGVGVRFELASDSQGQDEIAIISAVNTSTGTDINFSTTSDDGATYTTPLTLNNNGSTFRSNVAIEYETLSINSDNTAASSRIYFNGTDGVISYNDATNFFDFGNNISRGDLYLSPNTVSTGTGALNLNTPSGQSVNVQRDLVVGGNLTVNGTTTTVNSTTLTVDDKNIELASTASPSDTTADGGGITLKGSTDKKIFWDNATDRWYYDSGDGANNVFVRDLTDLSNVNTTSFTKGDMFYYNGTEWTNDNKIQADNSAERAIFQYNNDTAGALSSALFARKNFTAPAAFAPGDGSGIGIQLSNDNGVPTTFATYSAIYSTTNPQIALRTSTDSFDTNSVIVATIDSTDAKFNGTNLTLNANGTASAGVDTSITVERGTSGTDATLTWTENNDLWVFSNPVFANGGFIGADYIATNGNNIYFNNDDGGSGATSSLIVKRGSNADVDLRWNEDIDRWEQNFAGTYIVLPNQNLDTTANAAFAGVIAGGLSLGVDNNNEIKTTIGNLTINSAGGTTTVDDNLTVNDNLVVNGTTTLGNASIDVVNINSGTVNIGTTGINAAITVGDADTDTLTVNATTAFNNNVTIGSSNGDTLTVNSQVANNILFTDNGTTINRGVMGTVSGNDQWFVGGAATNSTNTGYMVIATGDDGTEPIFVRQYSGAPNVAGSTITNEIALMNVLGDSVFNNITVGSNGYIYSSSGLAMTVSGADVFVAGDLQVTGNDIKSSTGATALTLNDANVTVAGDLFVAGNEIFSSGGNRNLTFSGTDVIVEGDLTVTGNDIKKSGGTTVLTFSGTNLVQTAGDISVGGNTIRDSANTAAIELSGANVEVVGDLTVTGNDIKSSGGTTAITLSGANVSIAGDLTVNGTTTTINSTTLDVDDKNITIAKGAANAAAADGGGITLEGPATAATILYEADDDSWNLNKPTNVAGAFTASTASANAYFYEDNAGDEIAATIARTIVATGGTEDPVTIASTARKSMKVMVTADDGTNTHVIEAIVMRDAGEASGAQVTLYGELKTNTSGLGVFSADYDSGTGLIRLRAVATGVAIAPAIYPEWPGAGVTFKAVRTALF